VEGYCVRCRAKKQMVNATRTLMKNGRKAMIGICASCGTKMSVAGKWDEDPEQRPPDNAPSAGGGATPVRNGHSSGTPQLISHTSRLTPKVETG
jgi:hypothetical protein